MSAIDEVAVLEVFDQAPPTHRKHLLALRDLILSVAEELSLPGGIKETLKWGEPSYLPERPKIGTTVRLGVFDDDNVALYVNCRSSVIEQYRATCGDALAVSGNRALLVPLAKPIPEAAVKPFIVLALCYHQNKKQR